PATPSTAVGPSADVVRYGISLAAAGDVNGDGYDDIVIGTDVGSATAYVHYGTPAGLVPGRSLTVLTGGPTSAFGRWVAGAGDVNGDGYSDIIVGLHGVGQAR